MKLVVSFLFISAAVQVPWPADPTALAVQRFRVPAHHTRVSLEFYRGSERLVLRGDLGGACGTGGLGSEGAGGVRAGFLSCDIHLVSAVWGAKVGQQRCFYLCIFCGGDCMMMAATQGVQGPREARLETLS